MLELAIEQPALNQLQVSNELKKQNIFILSNGVRSIWLRHELPTFKLRLKAVEAKLAQEGLVLTDAQLAALEKANLKDKPSSSDEKNFLKVDEGHKSMLRKEDQTYHEEDAKAKTENPAEYYQNED